MLHNRVAVLARDRRARVGGALALILLVGGAASAEKAGGVFLASQRGQAFRPGELTIERGNTVQIVNDDGDILHHAYIKSSTFSFDSGDQQPGRTVAITFPVAGRFDVLCGIHPKMRLRVQVN